MMIGYYTSNVLTKAGTGDRRSKWGAKGLLQGCMAVTKGLHLAYCKSSSEFLVAHFTIFTHVVYCDFDKSWQIGN